ncbi:hypothetical protein Tco_0136449, partial [Tanacetum coccineum]
SGCSGHMIGNRAHLEDYQELSKVGSVTFGGSKRFQVTPKTSHLNAVKRIFKYLKGKPNLGLWYPRESPLDLEAFSDSDYGGSNLDRKSTTGGCQFLGQRLISWQFSTAEVHISTAGGTVTYSRRSAEKRSRHDKGKAILIEEEPKKKSKKDLEQE